MGQPIFILADDLTGAADAASYFNTERRRVRVTFAEAVPWDFTLGAGIAQVFDTESRALEPDDARRRIARAALPLASRSGSLRVFKKVDSTLRGNLGVEIETVLRTLGRPLAVLAPAFLAQQRIVRGGRLFVNGVPVTQTSFARDSRAPVRADRVADVVRGTTHLPVHEVGLDLVRSGPSRLGRALRGLAGSPGIVSCDAETHEDLEIVAGAVGDSSIFLPCGSAGLARALARVWGAAEAPRVNRSPSTRCHAVLVAMGSANPVAHEQLAVLRRATGIPVVVLRTSRLAGAGTRHVEVARGRKQAMAIHARMLALALSPDGIEEPGAAPRFEADLARVGVAWIEGTTADPTEALGLVSTGGDTTLALVTALGARAIWPEGEISPGVAWSVIEGPPRTMLLVSKAGGFGGPSALLDAARSLIDERALESRR